MSTSKQEIDQTAAAAAAGAGPQDNKTSIIGSISKALSSNKTPETPEDKPKEYIEKFGVQTKFIFDEKKDENNKDSMGNVKKPLKVILRGLYDEYYKKMMDGVLRFIDVEDDLNDNVINMFKRALQALAEKKRIKSAAPPYYYPEEGSQEKSKSVISQMVVYDGEEKHGKKLPILIYDPCIFELENGMKPSIDVEKFHNTIRIIFDKVELVGLIDKNMIKSTTVENMGVKTKGGGKYVGGGSLTVGEVWEILKERFAKIKKPQFEIALKDLINDNYDKSKEEDIKKTLGKKESFMEYQVIMLMLYIIIASSTSTDFGQGNINQMIIEIKDITYNLLNYVIHILYPDNIKLSNFKNDVENFATKYPDKTTAENLETEEFKNLELPEKITKLIIDYKEYAKTDTTKSEIKTQIEKNLDEYLKTVKSFFTNYTLQQGVKDTKYIDFIKGRPYQELMKILPKNLKIEYEHVNTSSGVIKSFTKGIQNRLGTRGIHAEEAPDNILLKDILKYGVWKLRFNDEKNESSYIFQKSGLPADDFIYEELYYMVRPGMLNYLITGENVINYDGHKDNTDGMYNRDESNAMPRNLFGLCFASVNYISPNYYNKFFEIDNTQNNEQTIYGKQFQIKECTINEENFKQSDWYKAAIATDKNYMGGQSKNITAKKNKSKKNKSKRNKSKKNK